MRIALIFPPGSDPRAPHLAIPALTAHLRQAGIEVEPVDLDIEGLRALLRPESLAEAARRLRNGAGAHLPPQRRHELTRLAEGIEERAAQALAVVRDERRFLHGHDLGAALANIDVALSLASAAAPIALDYSIAPVRYDVAGCDTRRLGDVLEVTRRPEANLFHAFWEAEALPRIEARDPLLVGVSLTNRQQLIPGLALARRLKERGHFVVLGGTLVAKYADEMLAWPEFFRAFADGVVAYEGESALVELANQLQGGRDFARVPNFRYLEGGRVRATPPHVENVEALPTPDFAGLPLNDYLSPRRVLPVYFGKGCYFGRCNFCDIPHINRISPKRYRRRSPERILEDVRALERRFGARHFVVTDESLAPELLRRIAAAFAGHEGRYAFTGYARLLTGFTPELCREIAAFGMRKLYFGLESASQRVLDHMDKGTRIADAPAVLRACDAAGIRYHLFGMIGNPEEEEADARATLDFMLEQAGSLGHPGNTCDIHRFGLDVRAPYFGRREQLGITVDPEALGHELTISLNHSDWRNTRGLSPERTDALLAEFNDRLRLARASFHNAPREPWPSFEEHAVVYAEHYRDEPFPWASALPDGERGFRLRVSPAAVAHTGRDGVTLTALCGSATLPARLAAGLLDPAPRRIAELVAACVAASPDEAARAEKLLRELVLALCAKGILQVQWLPPDVSPAPREAAEAADSAA